MAALEVVVAGLAMVLVVSGVLKIRDPGATTPMLQAVGLPSSRPVVYLTGAIEIATGAATLVIGARSTFVVMAFLYAGFAVIGVVLVRSGSTVSCGCFGQRSAEMTPVHVAVNAAAAVVAAVAAAVGATGLYAGPADRAAAVVAVATLAAALLAAGVVALLTVVPERLAAPAPLAAAPRFDDRVPAAVEPGAPGAGADALHLVEGLTPDGDRALVEVEGSDRIVLLAFLTTGCTTCSHFWQVFGDLSPDDLPGDRTDLVIVTKGDDHENPARVRELAPADHLVIRSSAAWRDYGVAAGPYFVLLDGRRDVVLGEGTATAWTDVATLVRRAVGAAEPDRMAE